MTPSAFWSLAFLVNLASGNLADCVINGSPGLTD
jgi:hypothetical protein